MKLRESVMMGMVVGLASAAHAQVVPLGLAGNSESLARAVSADGRSVFGRAGSPQAARPVRWSLQGTEPIFEVLDTPQDGYGQSLDTSADGQRALIAVQSQPYLWMEKTGLTPFASMPNWTGVGVSAIAPDGSFYGARNIGPTFRIVRWTTPTQPEELPLPDGATSTLPYVKVDGEGRAYFIAVVANNHVLFRTQDAGFERLATIGQWAELYAVSWNGETVGCGRVQASTHQNFAWSADTGLTGLITTAPNNANVTAVSPDGAVVFGWYLTQQFSYNAYAWTRAGGFVSAEDYFAGLGVDVSGWHTFEIFGVTPDGSRYVGRAVNPDGVYEAVMIIVGSCRADFNNDGAANSQDYFDFLGAFFAADQSADFNDDTLINSQDFFDFLGAFFTGCG